MAKTEEVMSSRPVPVILGGGGGTRLWPVSRDSFEPSVRFRSGDVGQRPALSGQAHRMLPGAALSLHATIIGPSTGLLCGAPRGHDHDTSPSVRESSPISRSAHPPAGESRPDRTELIEVQTGSYLGEDDIVHLEDDFSRQ